MRSEVAFASGGIADVKGRRHILRMHQEYSAEHLAQLADQAIATLPPAIRDKCADVVVTVVDFATSEQLASVGLIDRWTLSGLYEGRPLPERSIWDGVEMPPQVWLFRMPILAEMRSRRIAIGELVHHVVIHEIGHHFGFSDEQMDAIETQSAR